MSTVETNSSPGQSPALEVAHVLFLDIVAYSRLPMERQEQTLRHLQEVVRQTKEFERAQNAQRLISLPTGDGMALVFFHDVESPARCAMELAKALRLPPALQLRMGIHSGPVYHVADINANRNVAGGGINIAQRVMDCGDAGHILVSKSVADMLGHLGAWDGSLHDLGEAEVKHGVRVHLFNLCKDEVGNRQIPQKLAAAQKTRSRAKWKKISLGLSIVAVSALALGGYWYWSRGRALTEKDTIVLADFSNATGESVFGAALQAGLEEALDQSPLLNILSSDAVAQQLRYMGRPPDTPLTPNVARDVCRRQGSKAMLLGSISSMGSHYVIGLKAVNCRDGGSLGVEQVEAENKEQVLNALDKAASSLRAKLGEQLTSIQKYATPTEQATTPSLEALEAYNLAMKAWQSTPDSVVPLYKRAVAMDPNFALVYSDLSIWYGDRGKPDLCREYAEKAYSLRDRVSVRERFAIDSNYYKNVTGELDKSAQVYEEWEQTYPHDTTFYTNSGIIDSLLGKLDEALSQDRKVLELEPDAEVNYENLAQDYLNLERPDEAKTTLEQARSRGLHQSELVWPLLYQMAFVLEDANGMQQCLSAGLGGTEIEDVLLGSQSDTEAFHGRLSMARDLSRRAADAALQSGSKDGAAFLQASEALREAEFGNVSAARRKAAAAITLAPNRDVQVAAALAFARAGDSSRAQTIVEGLQKRFATDTVLTRFWLPSIRAAATINRDPALSIGYLEVTTPYELGVNFGSNPRATLYTVYLRGQAYLAIEKWSEAAAEFQKILYHRSLIWNFPLGALAHLQLARAYAGAGDTAKARAAYQEFFTLWQGADPDIPVLREATAEYAKLK
jgi:class 3 adenylate cyclase/tetratricopeptide (TPR) repeat protein